MPSKLMTAEDVVGRIEPGMTVGIGGWGSRRKPMALVRAILRSDLTDLTIVSYAGPDVGLLLQAGKASQGRLRLRDARLDPAGAAVLPGPPGGDRVVPRVGRGHVPDRAARGRPAGAVPADAGRARVGRARERPDAEDRARRPYDGRRGAGRRTRPRARRRAGAHEPRRPVRQRAVPRAGPLLRRPVLHGGEAGLRLDRAGHRHGRDDRRRRAPDDADQPHDGRRRRGDTERRALHDLHADLRARREVPEGLRHRREDARGLGGVRGAVPVRQRAGLPGRGRRVRGRRQA